MRLRKSSGKVLDLRMDEGSGAVAGDSSRYGNDGALTGCKWVENGLEFNGANDYVDCGNDASLNIDECVTITAWIKKSGNLGAWRRIVSTSAVNPRFILSVDTNERLSLYANSGGEIGISAPDSIPIDEWCCCAVVYGDDNIARLYINGVERAVSGAVNLQPIPVNILEIGRYTFGGYFNGSIDQVRIYNRALSAREIQKQYDSTKHKYI